MKRVDIRFGRQRHCYKLIEIRTEYVCPLVWRAVANAKDGTHAYFTDNIVRALRAQYELEGVR